MRQARCLYPQEQRSVLEDQSERAIQQKRAAVSVDKKSAKPMKGPFLEWEDQMIREHVEKYGPHHWPILAKEIKSRNAKQCRERWANHLDPSVTKTKWTEEEDLLIFQKYQDFGPKWAFISHFLPGRTDNSVKNRWHASISKRTVVGNDGKLTLVGQSSSCRGNQNHNNVNVIDSPEIISTPESPEPVKRKFVFPSLVEAFPFVMLDNSFPFNLVISE